MLQQILKCLHWPFCPGVFIAILAFVTAIVAFRIEKASKNKYERSFWVFLFFMLLVGEIWMMGIDRTQHDQEQSHARAEQLGKFQEIADEIKHSNTENQQHFDNTMASMKNLMSTAKSSLAQITGNGEFCFLTATPAIPPFVTPSLSNGPPMYVLAKQTSGTLPMDVCHVRVTNQKEPDVLLRAIYDEELGPLTPTVTLGKNGPIEHFITTNMVLPEGSYYIQISTRNARFYEILNLHSNVPGKGWQTIEVHNEQWKLLYHVP